MTNTLQTRARVLARRTVLPTGEVRNFLEVLASRLDALEAENARLPELRAFLHTLGTETNQGEVAFEFDGRFYRITKFDASKR